ncbi:MAG: S1 RNA-binding domain-containing protein [Synechococcus sp. SB0666_bin_14]|nr:S1 RNA-binding domain-containing protein [Synechococcus sp. SB0666_bin_14]MYG46413.1 S1 RNA-binding domain-containing protein [Synechococcus sp. SB0675_bin_6]MYJ58907.1 S1 RNA-binding domain-containing protein [Synechococcus sp. SB0672_bin_6]MYK92168.1 S1 RNA-binding domain-containing protein [Synechococcus sp. SB0669_bin_8]
MVSTPTSSSDTSSPDTSSPDDRIRNGASSADHPPADTLNLAEEATVEPDEIDGAPLDEEEKGNDVVVAAEERPQSRGGSRDLDDVGFTMEEFTALLSQYDYHFNPGDVVSGTIFNLEPKGSLIDIGAKTAAFMPLQEASINRVEDLADVLQPGDVREFFILSEENEDGQLMLSIRRIEYQMAWERVRQLQKEDATIYSDVFATNRGGALVRVEGLRGFIPGSHISTRKPKEELVDEVLPLKFLEVDEERNRLVLSHRRALVERKMNRLEVGEVVVGNVRGIKPYGAFIDIGGVSGLLHISEISHEHIETSHAVLNVGDQLKVMIIDLDAERGRISLSTKALEPEPGDMLTDPQKVFDRAEEMAALYKQMLEEQVEGEPVQMGVETAYKS